MIVTVIDTEMIKQGIRESLPLQISTPGNSIESRALCD